MAADRPARLTGVLTGVAFAVAAAARITVDRLQETPVAGAVTGYSTVRPSGVASFETANTVAGIGASAAGLGVLLFGATLVLVVRQRRARRLPLALGGVTVLLAAGAVAAAVVAASATDFATAVDASILRTALAVLAVASLPAVALAALRSRARR